MSTEPPGVHKPLCFVLMPFGQKPDPAGRPPIDFDRVYAEAIRPAVEEAGLEPIRADEERTGGIIHRPMFERLLLSEYALADLTTANANVFYELGVRHAARPRTTLAIFAMHQPIPFDVGFLRAIPYDLGPENRFGASEAEALRSMLVRRFGDLRRLAVEDTPVDSPIFQLLGEWKPPDIARLKTDVFRDQVRINRRYRDRMATARARGGQEGLEALEALEAEFGHLDVEEVGVVVDLLLSYRALGAWDRMIDLHQRMPAPLKRQVMVREQVAFALNRRAGPDPRSVDRQRALEILQEVEAEQGPSSETCGLIGRIHKDLYDLVRRDDALAARGHLRNAIAAYRRGFEVDFRDAYPGINLVTLLDIKGDAAAKEERDRLLPVVRFAAEQRLRGRAPDYWDHATMLEIAVLESDAEAALDRLEAAVSAIRERWEPATTARNLGLIREVREGRGEDVGWLEAIVDELEKRAG